MAEPDAKAGALPPWGSAELPEPRPFTFRNIVAIIGPGAIALSMSIGSGEWHFGPANAVKYGTYLMWLVTLSVLFQLLLNLQFIRYTLYTGEPTVIGFMRTRPGPWFWGLMYIFLAFCQVGWPGWALASASSVFPVVFGRIPGAPDKSTLLFLGYMTFFVVVVIVIFGGKIERTLEFVNWFMILFIVGFLLIVNIAFVPGKIWWESLVGHFKFGALPANPDWLLIGAFAAYAGNGGIGNVWTANWIRDKGMGMGSVVGYIPSAVGGKVVKVSPVGSVFPITGDNMSRWKRWWKYVHMDQTVLWAGGCLLGMYLNVVLAAGIIPAGTDITGHAAGSYQADFLKQHGGTIWWFMALLTGFWVFFGSQLSITEGFVRLSTDILWTASPRVREFAKGDIRRIYYTLIAVIAVWGCIAMTLGRADQLLTVAANVSGFILVVAGLHILVVRMKLPREVRGPAWQAVAVGLAVAFYFAFFIKNVQAVITQKRLGPLALTIAAVALVLVVVGLIAAATELFRRRPKPLAAPGAEQA